MVNILHIYGYYISRSTTTYKVEHCVNNNEIRAFYNPQDYDQKRKLFGTNTFVLAHSSINAMSQRTPLRLICPNAGFL